MKTCSKCFVRKPLDEYHIDSATIDGHCYRCKECNREASRKYYWENRDKVLLNSKKAYHDKKSGRRWRKAGVGLEDRQVQIFI